MASEDLFDEDFSEDVINELDKDLISDEEEEPVPDEREQNETELNAPSDNVINETKEQNVTVERNEDEKAVKIKLFDLPLMRIRNIMKLDPDLHVASNEAVFAVTRATEEFIGSLAQEAYIHTAQAKRKTVQKRDVDMAINAVDCLMFLDGAMF